jgi:serine/threonine protein phosphatase PrpC
MSLVLRYAVRSDRGLVRNNNEDSVYAGPRLLAIADGMGGHAAGEVASKLVVGSLEYLDEDRPLDDLITTLRDAVQDANQGIADAVATDGKLDGMGTTLTALRFARGQVGLVHVGDSRAYLLRGGVLSQITHDDTYVQSLVDSGRLTMDEAAHHPRKSVILRALTGTDVDPDISIREARAGDRYLLCTDGLSDVVTADTISATLTEGTAQEAADRLVELALRGGGPDNVTCVVADVIEAGYGDDLPVIAGAFVDTPSPVDADADSPAERAARMTSVRPQPPTAPPRRRGRLLRRIVLPLAVLAALIAGAGIFYHWTQTQYFVGRDGSEVAIFRGVNSQFGPIKFFSVSQNTDLKLTDLTQSARSQVESGITARNLADARSIMANLQNELLPLCRTNSPTPSAPSHTATPSAGRSTTGKPTPGPKPTPSPSTAPPRQLIPGVDCRLV